MIEPNVDWYGSLARRSAVADFLELAALEGATFSEEGLADMIRDSGWSNALGLRVTVPGSASTEEAFEASDTDESGIALGIDNDVSRLRAGDVLDVVRERKASGGAFYPFSLEPSGRLHYVGTDPHLDPYIRLLALTIAHATRMKFSPPPHEIFEDVVVNALTKSGFATVGIGAQSRNGGTFAEILGSSCGTVGLSADPTAASHRVFANDEGADILSNVWSIDPRPGGLQLVGQVTCARSDDWHKKINEPKKLQWRDWLGKMRSPETYLAVPHHVEDRMRVYLMSTEDRDVFDRMRLCQMTGAEAVPGEASIVEAVLAAGVSV